LIESQSAASLLEYSSFSATAYSGDKYVELLIQEFPRSVIFIPAAAFA
jgi:hypothetical protein